MAQTIPEAPVLAVTGLSAGYGGHLALQGVTFTVDRGDVVGIIGPNGAGKSTLMKTILGQVKPMEGSVSILGQPALTARKQVGYVPQHEQVDWDFPATVADVTLMGRYAGRGLFRRPTKEDKAQAAAALERVEMADRKNSLIGELSGGQRRRALLARALAGNPALLLMDEPMAGLDATSQHQLLDIFSDLQGEGKAIVFSTHDLSCVSSCAGKCLCLHCRMVAFGDPEEVLTEDVLNETFGAHLLLVHTDRHAYAYQHHRHGDAP